MFHLTTKITPEKSIFLKSQLLNRFSQRGLTVASVVLATAIVNIAAVNTQIAS